MLLCFYANPTLTITALAIRQGVYLANELKKGNLQLIIITIMDKKNSSDTINQKNFFYSKFQHV